MVPTQNTPIITQLSTLTVNIDSNSNIVLTVDQGGVTSTLANFAVPNSQTFQFACYFGANNTGFTNLSFPTQAAAPTAYTSITAATTSGGSGGNALGTTTTTQASPTSPTVVPYVTTSTTQLSLVPFS